jgi:ankyrin repeat protein
MKPSRFPSYLLLFILLLSIFSCGSGKNDKPGSLNKASEQSSSPDPQAEKPSKAMEVIQDAEKQQEMQEAALEGNGAIVESLLKDGVNPNAQDQEGRTALMYASFNGHLEIVRNLIDQGAEVGIRDVSGRTALLYACTGPFPETAKLLLENNADPNIQDAVESFTPLMHAAAEGQAEVVKVLLEYGADASMTDVDGETATMFAAQNGHTAVIELLK